MYLEPEYQTPFGAWQANPNPDTTAGMLKAVEPVLNNAIRSYATDMIGSPTIKSRARRLAAGAFKSYDPKRGTLRSHLLSNLQRLRRLAVNERQIISMPEQVTRDQISLNNALRDMNEQLGRPPSDREIMDQTGLSAKRLGYIRQGIRPIAEGTITQSGDEEGSGQYDPSALALTRDYKPMLEFIYDDVDPTNQFIMERVFGMHGHKPTSPSQVAKRLRITPAAVSHRMAQIQQQIDKLDDLGGL